MKLISSLIGHKSYDGDISEDYETKSSNYIVSEERVRNMIVA